MTERTIGRHPALGAPYGSQKPVAEHAEQCVGRYRGYYITPTTPQEMQHAILLGRRVSSEGGVTVYAFHDRLYLLSDHDLAEAGV